MRKFTIVILSFLLLLTGCFQEEQPGASIQQTQEKLRQPEKKVVLVMIDSMMGSLIDNSLEKGKIPALEFLIENGQYHQDLVSPFPTMSVVIESSLLTGQMAEQHRVPGLVWYNGAEQRLVDYGSTIQKMVKLGLRDSLLDSIYHLNNTHLNPQSKTIYEELTERQFTSGSINMIVYRGDTVHSLQLPVLLDDWLTINGSLQTKGPDLLALGSMVKPKVIEGKDLPDSVFSAFGLNDEYSALTTSELIKQGEQPDFLAIFLPDFDKEAHNHSPHYRVGFEQAESYLQEILNSYESWDKALEENIFIIIGDHGQDKLVKDEAQLGIDLPLIYEDFPIASLTEPIQPGELVIANNHRMTFVYAPGQEEILPELAKRAMVDSRISHAAFSDGEWNYVISPDYNDVFRFQPGNTWKDRYEQTWNIEGNEEIITIKKNEDTNTIQYVDYPDALNQLHSALHSHDHPVLVLNAKPGYTFHSEGAPLHVDGGEHGGLHKNDSLASIVIAGTDKEPKHKRIIDLKEYIIDLLENGPN